MSSKVVQPRAEPHSSVACLGGIYAQWQASICRSYREHEVMPRMAMDPLSIPAALWDRPDTLNALRHRDVKHLFQLIHKYGGASQTQIGIAVGMDQGKDNTYMNGGRQVTALEVFERIADGLSMPDHARTALGIAPRTTPTQTGIPPRDTTPELAGSSLLGSLEVDQDHEDAEDPLRRSSFPQLAAATLFCFV